MLKSKECLLPYPFNKEYLLLNLTNGYINTITPSKTLNSTSKMENIIRLAGEIPDEEYNCYIDMDNTHYNDDDDDYDAINRLFDEDDGDDADKSNYIYIINAILSGTARLNVLLPTATILAFTIFAPLFTNNGQCTIADRWLTGGFLALSAMSCIFFSLTDSFKTGRGRLYYGVPTLWGIRTFGGRARPCVPSDYRLRWSDAFHASLSLVAFLTFALLHNDVLSCYHMAVKRKVVNIVPLVVGFVVSLLFVLFPSSRRGIGYPFLLQSDALRSRN